MLKGYSFKYMLLKSERLVLIKYQGLITLERVIDAIGRIFNDPDFKESYSFLIDVRGGEFLNNIEKVKKYVNYLHENYPVVTRNKTAWVSAGSDTVVMATMFKILLGAQKHNANVFTTIAYSLFWLNIHTPPNKYEKLLEDITPNSAYQGVTFGEF